MFFLAHSANSTPNAVLSAIAAAFLLSPISASAADLYTKAPAISDVVRPAIDGFNTKFAAFGGSLANGALYAVQGSASIPLGKQWGLQVDGTIGSFDGRALGTAAGHWFQRNPGQGLIGLYASHTYWDRLGGVHLTQAAAEGAYYGNRWTLEGIAGVEFGNSVSNIVTATSVIPQNGNIPGVLTTGVFADGYDIKTRFFDEIDLKYYLTDNWNVMIGHRYLGGKHALALGTEHAFTLGNGQASSLFVEARLGEGDFHGVWGGLKFYWGQKDKSLIARHRQDDPPVWDTLFSITNSRSSSGGSSSEEFCAAPEIPIGGSCIGPS